MKLNLNFLTVGEFIKIFVLILIKLHILKHLTVTNQNQSSASLPLELSGTVLDSDSQEPVFASIKVKL